MKQIVSILLFSFLLINMNYSQSTANDCNVCDESGVELTVIDENTGSEPVAPDGFTQTISWDNGITSTSATVIVTETGTYTATVTWVDDTGACDDIVDTQEFNVTIDAKPECTIDATTSVCVGGTISLNSTINMSGSFTYDWSGPNGWSSTDSNPEITNVDSSHGGDYTLVVTSSEGCVSEECTITIEINDGPTLSLSGSCAKVQN